MPALRQGVLTATVVLALMTSATAHVCTGWAASAGGRMACCAAANHDCARDQADDCCAAGEQRQHAETPVGVSNAARTPSLVIPSPVAPLAEDAVARAWRPRQHLPDTPRPPGDARLLLSVFLI